MEIRTYRSIPANIVPVWEQLLTESGLTVEEMPDYTVMVREDDAVIASGSRLVNTFQYMAVDAEHRGEDLTAKIMTELLKDASEQNIRHLFLYTKPSNLAKFRDLLFYPVASTGHVLLMENIRNGARDFVKKLAKDAGLDDGKTDKPAGAIVMNADPFTLGHRYVIDRALEYLNDLYIFVVSEDRGMFSAEDRLTMVRRAMKDIEGVTVLPTGPYLISQASFPTYFLKNDKNIQNRITEVKCDLDVEIFYSYYVPAFNIRCRYVGTEPLDPVTRAYNEVLKENLIPRGVDVITVERLEKDSMPVSAGRVRSLIKAGEFDQAASLLPRSTYEYLRQKEIIPTANPR